MVQKHVSLCLHNTPEATGFSDFYAKYTQTNFFLKLVLSASSGIWESWMRMTKHWSFWTWTTATLPQVTHRCNCVQFGGFGSTQENVDMSIQNDAGCSRRWYLTETTTRSLGPQSGEATSAIMPLKTDMSGTRQKRLQEQKSFNSISKPLDHWWAVSDRLWMPPSLGWCARSLESFCVTADHIFLLGSGPHPRMSEPQHEIAWSWKWRSEWEITLMQVLHVTSAHSDTMFEQMFSGWDFHWELHWLSEHGALKPDRKSHNQDFTSWCFTMFCWVHSDCWDIDTIVCAIYWRYDDMLLLQELACQRPSFQLGFLKEMERLCSSPWLVEASHQTWEKKQRHGRWGWTQTSSHQHLVVVLLWETAKIAQGTN